MIGFLHSNFILSQTKTSHLTWEEINPLSQSYGAVSLGISAPFAGIQNHTLLVAGGCNFPDESVADGGLKSYYSDIFAFEINATKKQNWKKVGRLPTELAYGLTISTPSGMYCIGGKNNQKSVSSVYRILWNNKNRTTTIDSLPSLPITCNNMSGGYLNNTIYVVAGNQNDTSSTKLWALNLNEKSPKWKAKTPIPGSARLQAISFTQKGGLYVMSGYTPASSFKQATVHQTAYVYHPKRDTWITIPNFPSDDKNSSLSGGLAFPISDSITVCLGGVNKAIFEEALNREFETRQCSEKKMNLKLDSLKQVSRNYLLQPPISYQFNSKIWLYNSHQKTWKVDSEFPFAALAGAVVIWDKKSAYIINGEVKPGIRTPKMWKITFK